MVKFEEVKEEIIKKLNSKKLNLLEVIQEELTLVDGFINLPLSQLLSEITIGPSVVPMIMAIGKKTCKIYFFSFNELVIKHGKK